MGQVDNEQGILTILSSRCWMICCSRVPALSPAIITDSAWINNSYGVEFQQW